MNRGAVAMTSSAPRFQYSIHTLMLATVGVAIVMSLYRTGGSGSLWPVLQVSMLVGFAFIILTRRRLKWLSLLVLVGAIIGGIAAGELGICNRSVDVQGLNDPGSRLFASLEPVILGRWAFFGALAGAITSATVVRWLVARSESRKAVGPGDAPGIP
jgi:hypothetical protein